VFYILKLCYYNKEKDETKKEEEEVRKDPAFVPRRQDFWSHDDRWDDTPIEESRYLPYNIR
jgi:hypothetical protein